MLLLAVLVLTLLLVLVNAAVANMLLVLPIAVTTAPDVSGFDVLAEVVLSGGASRDTEKLPLWFAAR
jgi:hypothetical protein